MSKHTNTGGFPWWSASLAALLVGAWLLLRFLLRHPALTLFLLTSALAYVKLGQWGLAGWWFLLAGGLVAWWRLHGGSFDRSVTWRVRGSWRGWLVYGRYWDQAMDMAGLTVRYRGTTHVPRLRRVRSNSYMDRLEVQLLRGQHPRQYQALADTLAHSFGMIACRARSAKPGRIYLDFTRRDALADTVPALPIADEPDLRALPVGRREDGAVWTLPLLGAHSLIAGATGAGKGSVLQSLLRALGPYVRSGLVHLYGIDPKGGMELGAAGAKTLYRRLATSDPEEWVELLEGLVIEMQDRALRLAGVTRLHTPTVDDPLVVVVIDELASLTAYKPRSKEARDVFARIESALNLLLSQGRAVGFVVVAALQDPRKEVIPSRDLFPVRIALRLDEDEATKLVLGPNAPDRGADCTLIPKSAQGVAWVWCDGEPEPIRVRAGYPTDDDIAAFVDQYRPIRADAIDTTADQAAGTMRLGGLVVDLPVTQS